jgi:hypothetical protein
MHKIRVGMACFCMAVLLTGASVAEGAVVVLDGTRPAAIGGSTSWEGVYGSGVIFDNPATNPITVTGTIDISAFDSITGNDNSLITIGIISKDRYDTWVASGQFGPTFEGAEGWFETAYGAYQFSDGNGYRGALGQWLAANGETLQTYTGDQGSGLLGVEIVFDGSGMSLTLGGTTITRSYSNNLLAIDTTQPPYSTITLPTTDFSSGAIAVVGGFTTNGGGPAFYNVTFSQAASAPVPEPTSLAIWGIGALGMVAAARRRRNHPSEAAVN